MKLINPAQKGPVFLARAYKRNRDPFYIGLKANPELAEERRKLFQKLCS